MAGRRVMDRFGKIEALRTHQMYRSSNTVDDAYRAVVKCRCGYRVVLPGLGNIPDTDRAKLGHLLDVLESL